VAFLKQAFPALTACTFRTLEVDGNIGLLIEDAPHDMDSAPAAGDGSQPPAPFRSGIPQEAELTAQEARYFDGA
jgi:hypothetical protein